LLLIARRQCAGHDLIDERLEQMEVAPIDQRDLNRCAAQLAEGVRATEPDAATTLSWPLAETA
jgi:hypothetical protein